MNLTDRDIEAHDDDLTRNDERVEPDADERYQRLAEDESLEARAERLGRHLEGFGCEPDPETKQIQEATREELDALPY